MGGHLNLQAGGVVKLIENHRPRVRRRAILR